jgi:hypothetical protein
MASGRESAVRSASRRNGSSVEACRSHPPAVAAAEERDLERRLLAQLLGERVIHLEGEADPRDPRGRENRNRRRAGRGDAP